MIKLVLLAPCEKLIVGQDNNSSLITVLEYVQVNGQIGEDLPPNAALPYKWTAIALWHRTETLDEPIRFDSKFEVQSPSGNVFLTGAATFVVDNTHVNFRNTVEFPVIPIAENGTHWLKLSFKRSDDAEYTLAGEYPIDIIHALEQASVIPDAIESGTETTA
jgi:hypothetical protein